MKLRYLLMIGLILIPQSLFAKTANDPNSEQWYYSDIGVHEAWDYTTGSSDVVVAIIDNGFDTFHPDLIDNAWKNVDEIEGNGIDDDNNGYIDDVWGWNFFPRDKNNDGVIDIDEEKGDNNPRPDTSNLTTAQQKASVIHHGSVVAGIIGAKGNNEIAGSGINWDVKLMNVKVLGNEGVGSISNLIDAIRYAVDNGADIINISMVSMNLGADLTNAINYAYDNDVLVVAAAGNNMYNLNNFDVFPVCTDRDEPFEKVIGVSAVQKGKRLSQFTNTGSDCIDITAPGVDMAGPTRFSPTSGLTENFITGFNGTSFAAPLVSGAAALVKSLQPTWGPAQLMKALFDNTHMTPTSYTPEYENLFGAGLLQIDRAVKYAITGEKVRDSNQILESFTDNFTKSKKQDISNTTKNTNNLPEQVLFPKSNSQKTSSQKLARINLRTGDIVSLNTNHKQVTTQSNSFKNISSVESFINPDNNKRNYVVIKKHVNKSGSQVSILDNNYKPKYIWNIPFNYEVDIAVGDVISGGDLEVVISPKKSSRTVYMMYSIDGIELADREIRSKHNGVAVAVDNHQILTAFRQNNETRVHIYNAGHSEVLSFPVSFVKVVGDLRVANLDKDSDLEIVVSSGMHDTPWIGQYERTGALKSQFWGADPSFTSGIELVTLDHNNDGIDDLVVTPIAHGELIKIITAKLKYLTDWVFPQEKDRYMTVIQ